MISDILRIACIFTNIALIVIVTRANKSERRIVADLVRRTERLRVIANGGLDIPDNCVGRACWTQYRNKSEPSSSASPACPSGCATTATNAGSKADR